MAFTLIDPRTALLIAAALFVALPLCTWYALAGLRTSLVDWWCTGGLLAAFGILLIGVRGTIPDVISIHVGNLLLVACTLFWIEALRRDFARPWPRGSIVAILIGFLLVFSVLHEWASPIVRATFSKVVLFSLTSHIAWLVTCIARRERSLNAYAMAVAYTVISVSFGLQIVLAVITPEMDPDPFKGGVNTVFVALSAIMTAVVGHFSYVGMMLDRNVAKEVSEIAERTRIQESARLGEQMAALDRDRSANLMAASLGHELNQPLTAVLTNTQVAMKTLRAGRRDPDVFLNFLEKIAFNTQRASQILERIRELMKKTTPPYRPIDLAALVASNLHTFDEQMTSLGVALHQDIEKGPVWVAGDEVELSQVLTNVFRNALEAMSGSRKRILKIHLHTDPLNAHLLLEDSGTGLAEEATERAGQAFFSTKEHGLGIGLSLCHAIVSRHGGTLELLNAPGGGASLRLVLPRAAGQAQP